MCLYVRPWMFTRRPASVKLGLLSLWGKVLDWEWSNSSLAQGPYSVASVKLGLLHLWEKVLDWEWSNSSLVQGPYPAGMLTYSEIEASVFLSDPDSTLSGSGLNSSSGCWVFDSRPGSGLVSILMLVSGSRPGSGLVSFLKKDVYSCQVIHS